MLIRTARQWWTQSNRSKLLKSQDALLKTMIRSEACTSHHNNSGPMNSVEFRGSGDQTVVMAHGFGAGLGFFYANVDRILQSPNVGRLILVDWMGMGASERPPCRRPMRGLTGWSTSMCDARFTPSQAVDFFLDPFDEWRKQMDIDSMILVGHSLGGYLSGRYAVERPETIEKLVLASPVGIPIKPTNLLKGNQIPTSIRLIDTLWHSNFTPQQIVRAMGATRGRRNVRRALRGRIPSLGSQEVDIVADYLYHITAAHPSGEFAMNSLLEPGISADMMGVFAREPLEESLGDASLDDVTILFGDHDWMRSNQPGAERVVDRLRKNGKRASVEIVEAAGHHLYLENPERFVSYILV